MKRIKYLLIAAVLAITCVNTAFGWGQKGHDTVAEIASRHLTPTTAAAIDSLLDGKSIVYYANWLDNASHTPKYIYSITWHYKNIDADQTYESAPTLSRGNIVTALNREIGIMLDPKQPYSERVLALKMIVHLLGDLHQPMHLGHETDLGGNKWDVKYFDRKVSLHKLWDSMLPESAHKWSYTEWADQIDRLPAQRAETLMQGGINDWAKETYNICTQVYAATPKGTKISYDYIAEWTPTVEECFLKGGLRLSDILNAIFDPQYTPKSSIDFHRP
ncbi:MAG TPA: S1/P1 Nuclease [Porphyromonadaceae bacterium]|nr:S1/P1 Nuclease [Porphyromonadaceae bacterium]